MKFKNAGILVFLLVAVPIAAYGVYAEDPFRSIGDVNSARRGHTATLLQNGKVLVAGGWNGANTHATAELYDPATGTWTPTGKMSVARREHEATLLADGKVLVTGGFDGNYSHATAEIYDPVSGKWSSAGKMVAGTSNAMQ